MLGGVVQRLRYWWWYRQRKWTKQKRKLARPGWQDGDGYSSFWGTLQLLTQSALFSCKISSALASQASKTEAGISSKLRVPWYPSYLPFYCCNKYKYCAAQTGFKVMTILLHLSPKNWDYRHELPGPVNVCVLHWGLPVCLSSYSEQS